MLGWTVGLSNQSKFWHAAAILSQSNVQELVITIYIGKDQGQTDKGINDSTALIISNEFYY